MIRYYPARQKFLWCQQAFKGAVGTPASRCGVEGPISQKLRQKGLDTAFLQWLEGKADRLPRLHAVRQVKGADFAAAIRAAGWLLQLWTQPDKIAPLTPKDWRARYGLLQDF